MAKKKTHPAILELMAKARAAKARKAKALKRASTATQKKTLTK